MQSGILGMTSGRYGWNSVWEFFTVSWPSLGQVQTGLHILFVVLSVAQTTYHWMMGWLATRSVMTCFQFSETRVLTQFWRWRSPEKLLVTGNATGHTFVSLVNQKNGGYYARPLDRDSFLGYSAVRTSSLTSLLLTVQPDDAVSYLYIIVQTAKYVREGRKIQGVAKSTSAKHVA
jgi:hypothetical protein